ncbi:MAG: penicillin-binding protein 2 [Bacteroidia bacterium]|nr:penicillin-binding protein 2 [Bacteroidia bacterium]
MAMQDLKERQFVFMGIIAFVFFIYILRLGYLQLLSPDYARDAERNVVKRIVLEPSRGIIYDRKHRVYVTNTPIYDLMIVPKELFIPDTSIFERYLHLSRETIRKRIEYAKAYSMLKPSLLEKQISADLYAPLQEHLWQCRGVYTVLRNARNYLYPVGANYLGYISEVSKRDIELFENYYTQGDLIGTSGLERYYEKYLRGKKGVRKVFMDVFGRQVGTFENGKHDTIPEKGEDIVVGIDIDLQVAGEKLMQNKRGSIVAIEPETGEILAFVSAPSYDPNLLTGYEVVNNFRKLNTDTLKPLFDRPLMARYPPGSIFKIINALIALQEGTLSPNSVYPCGGGFYRNGGRPKCHLHPSPLDLNGAIQHSCNAYFAATYVDFLNSNKFRSFNQAYDVWYKYSKYFGVGQKLNVDIPGESFGRLPSRKFYDKWYKANRWRAMTIVSNSIGQGEVEMTPLQMANCVAAIANKGWYIQPHFFKSFYVSSTPSNDSIQFKRIDLPIDSTYFSVVFDAMEQVVLAGTGYLARVDSISICGKTGTAQNPHGDDHSVFVAFAPKDKPKIAIAVIIENATWGGAWAAPIAGLMIEQYLKGKITNQALFERMEQANFIDPEKNPNKVKLKDNKPKTE